jgi:hypothetical protein
MPATTLYHNHTQHSTFNQCMVSVVYVCLCHSATLMMAHARAAGKPFLHSRQCCQHTVLTAQCAESKAWQALPKSFLFCLSSVTNSF